MIGASHVLIAQMHNGRAPAAELFVGKMEFSDVRMFRQQRVNGTPQIADAFAVNDPHPQNSPRLALGEIIRDKVLHFVGPKRVQV